MLTGASRSSNEGDDRGETFGPVIPIAKVASIDEAIELANDSRYGLGSTVFAGKAARSIANRLRAGMTSINSVMAFAGIPTLPFGGIGDSGFGRIHGDEGIREYTRIKSTAEQTWRCRSIWMSFRQTEGHDEAATHDGQAALRATAWLQKAGDLLRRFR